MFLVITMMEMMMMMMGMALTSLILGKLNLALHTKLTPWMLMFLLTMKKLVACCSVCSIRFVS